MADVSGWFLPTIALPSAESHQSDLWNLSKRGTFPNEREREIYFKSLRRRRRRRRNVCALKYGKRVLPSPKPAILCYKSTNSALNADIELVRSRDKAFV